jgi:hypothetical protein
MNHRIFCGVLALALASVLAAPALAQLAPYNQDFEGLDQAAPDALSADGWLVFGNVWHADGWYMYPYGPFPAPNGGAGFSAIAAGAGGAPQGAQQLVVYSDYNNGDHGNGNWIEANVFQEQRVGAADVGSTWRFDFDAKRDNIEGDTTALAFIKTLDPNAGYGLSNFITVDMTGITTEWGSHSLEITIDASLAPDGTGPQGHLLQIGFLSTATNWQGSGILYDNIAFFDTVDTDADGIFDNFDVCPETVIPESVPTNHLQVNRYALVDGDDVFDTTPPPGGGGGPTFEFTTNDTLGCSCEQIIEAWALGWGHTKFGCSPGVLLQWKAMVWNLELAQPETESQTYSGGLKSLSDRGNDSPGAGSNGTGTPRQPMRPGRQAPRRD